MKYVYSRHGKCSRSPFTGTGKIIQRSCHLFFARIWKSFSFTNSTCGRRIVNKNKWSKWRNNRYKRAANTSSRFRVSFKHENVFLALKRRPANGKRGKSQVTCPSAFHGEKIAVLNLYCRKESNSTGLCLGWPWGNPLSAQLLKKCMRGYPIQ